MHQRNPLLIKFISLLSVIRWYNIAIIMLAQYLAVFFLFKGNLSYTQLAWSLPVHIIIFSTALIVAGGYIINGFYDLEKDIIHRPDLNINRLVSQNTLLKVYLFFNILAVGLSALISIKAVLYFSVFSFGVWAYSHKLQKYPFVRELTATGLASACILGVALYFDAFSITLFWLALFLFAVEFIREMVKDLESYKADRIVGYSTVATYWGLKRTRQFITVLGLALLIVIGLAHVQLFQGKFFNYFGVCALLLTCSTFLLNFAHPKATHLSNQLLKLLVLVGIAGMVILGPTHSL